MPNKADFFSKIKIRNYRDVNIYLIPLPYKDKIIFNLFSIIIYQIRLFFLIQKLIKKRDYNIIQVRDNTLAGIIGLLIKYSNKIPMVYNYSFPSYIGAYDGWKIGEINFLKLIYWKSMDIFLKKIVLKFSDFIIPISWDMIQELKKDGIEFKKMYPLPLGIESQIFNVKNSLVKSIKKKHSIDENIFIFIYVGAVTKIRGLEIVIKSFKKLIELNYNSKLVIVGEGNDLENIKKLVGDLGIERKVIFTGRVPYWDVPSYIIIANVGLSLIYPRKCFLVSSPCKLFEYMILKKPVIANKEIPEHKNVIKNNFSGLLTKYSEKDITSAMIYMIDNPKKIKDMGKNGYKWTIENRTFKKMTKSLENNYFRLLN
jgi:glycosyltransferase involved in cell wall biosynthesis